MAFSTIYTYTLSIADDDTQLSPCLPEVQPKPYTLDPAP